MRAPCCKKAKVEKRVLKNKQMDRTNFVVSKMALC